jgi:ribosome silencing factor RsfS/YbeB/iojap
MIHSIPKNGGAGLRFLGLPVNPIQYTRPICGLTQWQTSTLNLRYPKSAGGKRTARKQVKQATATTKTQLRSATPIPTRPPKTRATRSMEKKDRILAAVRDAKRKTAESANQLRSSKNKTPSPILKAAGIKPKKMSLKDQQKAKEEKLKTRKGENLRKVELSSELNQPVEVVGDVAKVLSPQRVAREQEKERKKAKRDYLVPTDPGYTSLPPPMTLTDIVNILKEEKAMNMFVMDVSQKCNFAKYMVTLEGRSGKHMRGIAERIIEEVKRRQRNLDPGALIDIEGKDNNDWMVVDCGDILIHLFSAGARRYYDLEGLWTLKGTLADALANPDEEPSSPEELEDPPDLDDVPGGWHPLDMKV